MPRPHRQLRRRREIRGMPHRETVREAGHRHKLAGRGGRICGVWRSGGGDGDVDGDSDAGVMMEV